MIRRKSTKTRRRQPREIEIDAHVGGRIHERRKLLGLSQTDLATGFGVSFQQLQKYESGANRISAGKLYQCAQILNTDIEYFFAGLPSTSTRKPRRLPDIDENVMQTDETLTLVRGYYLLPIGTRRQIRDLVQAVTEEPGSDSPE